MWDSTCSNVSDSSLDLLGRRVVILLEKMSMFVIVIWQWQAENDRDRRKKRDGNMGQKMTVERRRSLAQSWIWKLSSFHLRGTLSGTNAGKMREDVNVEFVNLVGNLAPLSWHFPKSTVHSSRNQNLHSVPLCVVYGLRYSWRNLELNFVKIWQRSMPISADSPWRWLIVANNLRGASLVRVVNITFKLFLKHFDLTWWLEIWPSCRSLIPHPLFQFWLQ